MSVCKHLIRKYGLSSSIIVIVLSLSLNAYYKQVFAISPSYDLQEIIDENNHWVQTYGNSDTNLKSNSTNILAVNYVSDGRILNATFWLPLNSLGASIYNQPYKRTSYGMLIDVSVNPETGFRGADYDFYTQVVNGKWSEYLYQLSSTGDYALVESRTNFTEPFGGSIVGPDYAKLSLDLDSLNYPHKYNLLFYTAESYKSNEVRQFTSWVTVPPPSLQISTSPSNIVIRQGEEQIIPARIKSTDGFSNDVINITTPTSSDNNNFDIGATLNPTDLHIAVLRNQPPLFKIDIPRQTPLGIYTIPLVATIREPSLAALTKPISVNTAGGSVNPVFELAKKYPALSHITKPINLTVTVIAPLTISEQFKDFWGTYGQFIGLFAGGFIGAYAKVLLDKRKKKHEESERMNN